MGCRCALNGPAEHLVIWTAPWIMLPPTNPPQRLMRPWKFWTATASAFPVACRSEAEIPSTGAAGLASELKIDIHPYGEDSPRLAAGRVQCRKNVSRSTRNGTSWKSCGYKGARHAKPTLYFTLRGKGWDSGHLEGNAHVNEMAQKVLGILLWRTGPAVWRTALGAAWAGISDAIGVGYLMT